MAKTIVAACKVRPDTILDDIRRLMELARFREALDPSKTTILKDNISWHFPFPGANTTPWQMEGVIRALRSGGYDDLSCVQNKTVVTNAFKGEDLNHYVPIFKEYGIPVLYNFKEEEMTWVVYKPKASMLVLDQIFPEGITVPDYFFDKNIIHLPTVKCVAGETEVVLADGSVVAIRDLVREQLEQATEVDKSQDGDLRAFGRVDLLSMTEAGEVQPTTATCFWRTTAGNRRVVRMRTRTGRTLTATADHPVLTPSGWVSLGDLTVGSRLAAARSMRIAGRSQPLPPVAVKTEFLPVAARAGRKYSAAFNQEIIDSYTGGETTTAIAARVGVRWQIVQSALKRHRVPMRRNVVQITTHERTSPEFWRWMGYVFAEGNLERGECTDKLWWANSQPEIVEDFLTLTRRLFGVDAHAKKNGRQWYVYGKRLGRFIEEMGLPIPLKSDNKRVPEMLFRCPDEEIAAFLSAYLDGDGHVSKRQAEVTATTKSPQLAHDLQILFARLGAISSCKLIEATIPGVWSESRTYSMVTVSGSSLECLAGHLRFRHPRKKSRFEIQLRRLATSKQPSNWDIVPLPREEFRSVRRGLGLTQASSGKPCSANSIENGYTNPTPRVARYFVDLFEKLDTGKRYADEVSRMRLLVSHDLAWDSVSSIEYVPAGEVELFDITVPETGSFIGNGLVVHNCHIYTTTTGAMKNAFGGLLNTKRHYTHSWIHQTLVDLLAIQKEIHSGIFAVMDGTTAGNGPGPRTMVPEIKNWMLASADQVAIDALAARMMGFDPMTIDYIRLAHEKGLGCGDTREIEVVGDDAKAESWGFRVGDNSASRVGDLLWFSPLKRFQNFFFRTPLVNVFILGSEIYHDYYRWPARDRKAFEKWLGATEWGKLFQDYATRGTLASAREG
jgi:uncharacterized protein (DUF362 family)